MPTPVPETIRAELVLSTSLCERADVVRVLEAIEREELFAPTRWGSSFALRDVYDRAAVVAHAVASERGTWTAVLRRAKPVAMVVELIPGALGSVCIEASGQLGPLLPELFAALDRLASTLELELGCVDLRFVDQPHETFMLESGGLHVGAYLEWGLPTVFVRTYFGARLCELMGGIRVLEQSGGVARELEHGMVALDLLAEPWAAEPEALKRVQVRVEKALRLTGIVARQASEWRTLAAPRWVPPPATGAPPRPRDG